MENKLKQGLSILYDMEKSNYFMTIALTRLDNKIASLGHSAAIREPQRKAPQSNVGSFSLSSLSAGMIIGGIIGAVVGLVSAFSQGDLFLTLISFSFITLPVIFGVIGAAIGAVVCAIIGALAGSRKDYFDKEKAEKYYKDQCKIYEDMKKQDNARVTVELRQKGALLHQRADLMVRLNESKKKLNSFYDTMGIAEKFRNLIAIGYMYDLAELGISNKLEGADGLYLLTKNELRWDKLDGTLENISEKLDMIIENQHQIKEDIRNLNYTCERIVKKTEDLTLQMARNNEISGEIAKNTELGAYYAERSARELEYQNFMLTYVW